MENEMRGVWVEDIEKTISVMAGEDDIVSCFYKVTNGDGDFVEVTSTPTYKNGGVWEIVTSFPQGKYLLRILVNGRVKHLPLTVVDVTQHEKMLKELKIIKALVS